MADRPEARIPCPQCGGAIHPVAGKCKHCKADLAALRASKPQAQVALPKLAAVLVAPPPPPKHPDEVWARPDPARVAQPVDGSRASPVRELDPARVQFSAIGHDSEPVPILPPRPTGRMFVEAPERGEKWPIVVIAISAIAILLSIGALVR